VNLEVQMVYSERLRGVSPAALNVAPSRQAFSTWDLSLPTNPCHQAALQTLDTALSAIIHLSRCLSQVTKTFFLLLGFQSAC